jgi:hypothetical protein
VHLLGGRIGSHEILQASSHGEQLSLVNCSSTGIATPSPPMRLPIGKP